MTNDEHISEITVAFSEALQAAAQDLAEDFVKRVKSELEPSGATHREFAPVLRDGTISIAGTRTQSETLEALLDAAEKVTPASGTAAASPLQPTSGVPSWIVRVVLPQRF
jgi:hypothetical protein